MGKLNIFTISFANTAAVFYAGTMVQGHVTIELKEPMKMRGVRLNFEGKAYVHWTERHSSGSGKNRHTTTRHYSATEKYFDQDVLLHGTWPSQGSNTTELPQGRHTFPFQLQLPPGLPSSFEGDHGHVRYVVSCKIDKPWKFDHKTKRPFTIISVLDLNSQPSYSQRLQSTNEKTLCCLCCKSGPIIASFHLDRQGYVPGEAIRLSAEISNGANRRMDKSYVELIMIVTFHATTKSRTVKNRVAMLTRPAIPAHSEDVWSGEELVIPPLPPSYLVGCGIIDIKYIVQLNVDPSGPALDLEIPLEVVIGTIPLMSVVQQYPPSPPVGFNEGSMWPTAPPMQGGASAPPPNMPPPSYNECITGRVDVRGEDDEHTHGDLSFAPAYTYYNWGRTPGALPPPLTEKSH
ncbi:hypothetical protein RRG08_021660 [Elysia crispata]|uniref:Arrestin C-terminal-like domain-containing protein n=1 Tax=Elysia crispata TaxID=231223 RepID=A0AAE1CJ04_9GAST|nr:hypothetical protein RRG08_021660 [Elysia crispata]